MCLLGLQASEALAAEDARCRAYVNTSTRCKLIAACRGLMLGEQGTDLIHNTGTGMMAMLRASYRTQNAIAEGVYASESTGGSSGTADVGPDRVRQGEGAILCARTHPFRAVFAGSCRHVCPVQRAGSGGHTAHYSLCGFDGLRVPRFH